MFNHCRIKWQICQNIIYTVIDTCTTRVNSMHAQIRPKSINRCVVRTGNDGKQPTVQTMSSVSSVSPQLRSFPVRPRVSAALGLRRGTRSPSRADFARDSSPWAANCWLRTCTPNTEVRKSRPDAPEQRAGGSTPLGFRIRMPRRRKNQKIRWPRHNRERAA